MHPELRAAVRHDLEPTTSSGVRGRDKKRKIWNAIVFDTTTEKTKAPVQLPKLEAIPAALRQLNSWLVWTAETDPKTGKASKVPYHSGTHTRVDVTNINSWTSCAEAIAGVNGHSGIGFGLDGSGSVFIDLDHVRNPETGEILPWAKNIVDILNSYTEISPGGDGLHVLISGTLPAGHRTVWRYDGPKGPALEIYSQARYATFTGNRLPDCPAEVQVRDALSFYTRCLNDELGPGSTKVKSRDAVTKYTQYLLSNCQAFDFSRTSRPLMDSAPTNDTKFDLRKWMREHGVEILKKKQQDPWTVYEIVCPGSHGEYDKHDGKSFYHATRR